LFRLAFSWKNRISQEELAYYTTKGPNINSRSIAHSQYYLWSSVKSALNIGIDLLVLETTRTNINYFYACFLLMFQENILWLQITMYDVHLFEKK